MLDFARKRMDLILAGLLCCLALSVYLKTLCPTLYWGDCGELASAAYALGITHPTGYPVWTMLAHGWAAAFPFGTFIWRLNVLSAVLGTIGVGCVFGAARGLGVSRPAALMCGGAFAFSSTFWQQCLFAETYSLSACWCAALLALAFRWRARGCRRTDLILLALAYGFAMTNGQINTLFLPGFVVFVLGSDPSMRQWRDTQTRRAWLRLAAFACLPLLSYAYLPLRALAHPAVCWGNPRTLFGFWYHVTGRDYAPLMFHSSFSHVRLVFVEWAWGLRREFAWPLVALAAWGLLVLARRDWQSALLLGWVVVADVGFVVNYFIYNHYIYFLPCYVALAVLLGAGADNLAQKVTALVSPEKKRVFALTLSTCLLLPVPVQLGAHWSSHDLHNSWACYDYGRNLLASVPPHGFLADTSEDTSQAVMMYLQTVEHVRPDVTLLQCQMLEALYDPHYGRWANAWYWDQLCRRDPLLASLYASDPLTVHAVRTDDILRRLIPRALAAHRAVVVAGIVYKPLIDDGTGRRIPMESYLLAHFDPVPLGLVVRVYPARAMPAPPVLLAETERVWGQYRLRGLSGDLYEQDNFLTPLLQQYAVAALTRARIAYALGDYGAAEQSYHFVLKMFPSGEAAVGLDRCADARAHRRRLASAARPA